MYFTVFELSLYQSSNVYPVLVGLAGFATFAPLFTLTGDIAFPPSVSKDTVYAIGFAVNVLVMQAILNTVITLLTPSLVSFK